MRLIIFSLLAFTFFNCEITKNIPVTEYDVDGVRIEQQKFIACFYEADAFEMKTDTTEIKIGNFPVVLDIDVDYYMAPVKTVFVFPGKRMPTSEIVAPTLEPYLKGATVVSIHNIVRLNESCKVYDLEPSPKN
jgi:hypothetical protein